MLEAFRDGGMEARWIAMNSVSELENAIKEFAPDMFFGTFFRFRETSQSDRYISRVLKREGVGWIGSSDEALEIALSKPRMKKLWRENGVKTPDWFHVRKERDGSISGIELMEKAERFPYFVKPACEGNSRGIDEGSIARTSTQLLSRALWIVENYGEAIAESYIGENPEPREFTVALIGNFPQPIISAVEIIKEGPGPRFVTQADKDGHGTRLAPIADPGLRRKVERLARKAFLVAGVNDYARCDLMLHGQDLYAMELNGQPMVPDRWFEGCAREAGLNSVQYLQAIALAGISRHVAAGLAFIPIPRALYRSIPRSLFMQLAG